MKCFKCRNNLPDDSKFCQFCGADLTQIDDHMSADEQPAETEVEASAAAVATEEAVNATRGRKFRSLWWLFLPIALCVFAAIVSVLSARSESSTTPAQAAENVLYLEIYDSSKNCIGSGSGFLINDGVTLVTNYHVIEDAYQIFAKTSHGETSVEVDTVWAYDETADIAILKCSSAPGASPLRLADSNQVKQGDSIYAAGYPLGVANTLSDGIISSRYVDENGVDLLQITAPISGGSSGGALLNEFGEVIGVVCAYYIDGQNMNIAIAANVIDKVLRENRYIQPIFSLYLKNHPLPKPEDLHPAKPLPVPDDSKPVTCSHSYGAWTIETEATCTRRGSKVRTCSLCGKVQTATIDMIEHTKVVDPAIAATCTTEGKTEGARCSACGMTLTAQGTIPLIAHEYLGGSCERCGAQDPSRQVATSISLSSTDCFVELGNTLNLVATVLPEGTVTKIKWTSSDPERISVNNGVVRVNSISGAYAKITATTENGLSASCRIYAKQKTPVSAANSVLSYRRFPNIPSLDNLFAGQETVAFWHEYRFDNTNTHFYTYLALTEEASVSCAVNYMNYLIRHGYTYVGRYGDLNSFVLNDPSGKYEIQIRAERGSDGKANYHYTISVWVGDA